MFVMTVDQRGSRSGVDLVPQALERLALHLQGPLKPAAPFERTAGDEIQGVLTSAVSVYAATRILLRHAHWYVGIGAGRVDQPMPRRAAEGGGPAYWAAREAVNTAKTKRAHTPVSFVAHGGNGAAQGLNGLLQLLGFVLVNRSEPAWQALDQVTTCYGTASGVTQKQAAQTLGVTAAAISARLSHAGLNQELEVQPLVLSLLERAHTE